MRRDTDKKDEEDGRKEGRERIRRPIPLSMKELGVSKSVYSN